MSTQTFFCMRYSFIYSARKVLTLIVKAAGAVGARLISIGGLVISRSE
jgi:hypothetical protein